MERTGIRHGAVNRQEARPMTLRRTIRRMNIMVGTTVAVIVAVLSVTGVVLTYELGLGAGVQGEDHRSSRFGMPADREAHAPADMASTLILHCAEFPCLSRDQMLVMAAAHLDVPYWTLAAAADSLGARRPQGARR